MENERVRAKYEGLAYQWVAELIDGTVVTQFDEEGYNEVLFKDVKDKVIVNFWLENTTTKQRDFAVNLRSGEFFGFGRWIGVGDGEKVHSKSKLLKYRLIYFRQVTREFAGFMGPQLKCDIVFFIGWQANEPETGANIKKLLQVYNENYVVFG